ncbi:MAG: UDP-N-acetylmuramoyl-L-alanine--D-glutamate ligase [Tissierellaceae bacterium]|nr:UDP-N-acetylmuramoyl-L-alanine--D-glutamate ligase [Tissierellaceae bacterium]
MDISNKNVLVIGLGISGVSTIKALNRLGAIIWVTDTKQEEDVKDVLKALNGIPINKVLGVNDMDLSQIDLIVKSPGVPPYVPIIEKAINEGIEVITDIEFGYRLNLTDNFIAITGTNGKTTTTTLVGEVFKAANYNTHVVGNIGKGILGELIDSKSEDIFIIEASSFQLEHTRYFKPKVSLILNLAPDHIDWHGSYENYITSKKKIFNNQDIDDFIVLNYDDPLLRTFKDEMKSNLIWFSINEKLDKGIYIDGEYIFINDGNKNIKFMPIKEIKILGRHNLENVLACIGICISMGIDLGTLRNTIKSFNGVEHRLEFVVEKDGIKFYNDSKGTNPEASIKAISAIPAPIILIAGGYDKQSDFDEFISSFKGKVKAMILLGQTKYKLKESADNNNFSSYYLVETLDEAVNLAYKLGIEGDNILLSPACASWGMFNNFEERGKLFKEAVYRLGDD